MVDDEYKKATIQHARDVIAEQYREAPYYIEHHFFDDNDYIAQVCFLLFWCMFGYKNKIECGYKNEIVIKWIKSYLPSDECVKKHIIPIFDFILENDDNYIKIPLILWDGMGDEEEFYDNNDMLDLFCFFREYATDEQLMYMTLKYNDRLSKSFKYSRK